MNLQRFLKSNPAPINNMKSAQYKAFRKQVLTYILNTEKKEYMGTYFKIKHLQPIMNHINTSRINSLKHDINQIIGIVICFKIKIVIIYFPQNNRLEKHAEAHDS